MKTMKLGLAAAGALATAVWVAAAGAQCLTGGGNQPNNSAPSNSQPAGHARLIRAAYGNGGDFESSPVIVGMWHVKLVSQTITYFNGGPSLPFPEGVEFDAGYQQWHSDGTEMLNSGGRPPFISSFCMGVWQQTGPRTFKLNHFAISWTFDPNSPVGSRVGPSSIVETVTVSPDGKSFTGNFLITDYLETDSPGGSTILKQDTVSGPITGTRIDVNTHAEPIF